MKTPEEFIQPDIDSRFGAGTRIRNDHYTADQWMRLMEKYADQFKNPPKKTIEERKTDFWNTLNEIYNCQVPQPSQEMLNDFFEYWTEHSEGAKKMRFEKEKVFDIKKRLERWKRNQKPNYGKSEPVDRDKQLADYLNRPR